MVRLRNCLTPVMCVLFAGGCAAPLSLISFAGSTVAKTAHNYADAEKEEAPRRHAVAEANVALAIEYMRQKRYQDALVRLERAKEAEPRYAATYSMLGLLYQKLGRPEAAEANYRKSIDLDEGNPEYLNNYGQFLCMQGRFEEAETTFLDAAQNPLYLTPEVAYANAGACAWADKRDPVRARKFYGRALERDPALPAALISMSEIEYAGGDYAAADHYYRRYHAGGGHTARSLWLGIRIKQRTGDADARASYALLLRQKFPDSEEARLLNRPGGLQETLAMEQSPAQRGLINTFEHFSQPELLTGSQLLKNLRNQVP